MPMLLLSEFCDGYSLADNKRWFYPASAVLTCLIPLEQISLSGCGGQRRARERRGPPQRSRPRRMDWSHVDTRLSAKCFALPAPRSASDPGLGGRLKWNLQRHVRNVNSGWPGINNIVRGIRVCSCALSFTDMARQFLFFFPPLSLVEALRRYFSRKNSPTLRSCNARHKGTI